VIERHPDVTFVGAHLASSGEDLARLAAWLDKYPNLYTDVDARISELGRQPYTARAFLIKYQDRVMFGTDYLPNAEKYRVYYRFLESDDEYWPEDPNNHDNGFWRLYGVFLPKDALRKIYFENAERILIKPRESVRRHL
jgi:predicted TIM-barrel fold metal-dependent hydrolase